MNDIITNSNIQSISENSKGLAKEHNIAAENAENNLDIEPLKKANREATNSLVDKMLNDQHDKVNPGVSVTKDGALDLNDNHK